MVCLYCGVIGADARPNWLERSEKARRSGAKVDSPRRHARGTPDHKLSQPANAVHDRRRWPGNFRRFGWFVTLAQRGLVLSLPPAVPRYMVAGRPAPVPAGAGHVRFPRLPARRSILHSRPTDTERARLRRWLEGLGVRAPTTLSLTTRRSPRAATRGPVSPMPPQSDHERRPPARRSDGALIRSAQGVHEMRDDRRRFPAELARARPIGNPTSGYFGLRPLLSFSVLLSDHVQICRPIFAAGRFETVPDFSPFGRRPRALVSLPLFMVLDRHGRIIGKPLGLQQAPMAR